MPSECNKGTDPEFTGLHRETHVAESAPNVIPGMTKKKPYVGKHITSMFADNANIELNINPQSKAEDFVDSIRLALSEAKGVIGNKYYLAAIASLNYPTASLNNPICRQFGCEPDFDAWTVKVNHVLTDAADSDFRTAGGHIHIGHKKGFDFLQDDWGKIDAIKAMDTVLGIQSLFVDDDEASITRRKLYGSPGAHRPKDYGVEYRTLSNFWLRDPKLSLWAANMTDVAMKMVEDGVLKKIQDLHTVPTIIRENKLSAATGMVNQVADYYPEVRKYNMDINGLNSSITKFKSLETSWGI